jgi:hypothetical protein
MQKQIQLKFVLELLWWLITGLLMLVLLFPIYQTKSVYPFWQANVVFILVFITFTRYIFLLRHTFLAYFQAGKAILFVVCIPLFLYLLDEMSLFQVFLANIGLEETFKDVPMNTQGGLVRYVKSEMLFFGTGSLIVCILFPVRLLISFWRTHNRGTV